MIHSAGDILNFRANLDSMWVLKQLVFLIVCFIARLQSFLECDLSESSSSSTENESIKTFASTIENQTFPSISLVSSYTIAKNCVLLAKKQTSKKVHNGNALN